MKVSASDFVPAGRVGRASWVSVCAAKRREEPENGHPLVRVSLRGASEGMSFALSRRLRWGAVKSGQRGAGLTQDCSYNQTWRRGLERKMVHGAGSSGFAEPTWRGSGVRGHGGVSSVWMGVVRAVCTQFPLPF